MNEEASLVLRVVRYLDDACSGNLPADSVALGLAVAIPRKDILRSFSLRYVLSLENLYGADAS